MKSGKKISNINKQSKSEDKIKDFRFSKLQVFLSIIVLVLFGIYLFIGSSETIKSNSEDFTRSAPGEKSDVKVNKKESRYEYRHKNGEPMKPFIFYCDKSNDCTKMINYLNIHHIPYDLKSAKESPSGTIPYLTDSNGKNPIFGYHEWKINGLHTQDKIQILLLNLGVKKTKTEFLWKYTNRNGEPMEPLIIYIKDERQYPKNPTIALSPGAQKLVNYLEKYDIPYKLVVVLRPRTNRGAITYLEYYTKAYHQLSLARQQDLKRWGRPLIVGPESTNKYFQFPTPYNGDNRNVWRLLRQLGVTRHPAEPEKPPEPKPQISERSPELVPSIEESKPQIKTSR